MRAEDKTARLGSEPVGSLFARLALPAVLGQLVVLLNNVVDRMWVGHIGADGALSLGAVGLSMPIHNVFLAFILMLAAGMTPNVSILLGKGDRALAARVSGACFGLATVFNVITVAVILLFADWLLLSFGAGEASLPFARSYLTTLAWGMPFSSTLLMVTMWLNSQGYVSESVLINFLSVAVNAVLDPILIFPCGLGVTGAALATNVGAIVALAEAVRRVRGNPKLLHFGAADLLPRFRFLKQPVLLGSSTLLNVALESVGLLLLNASLQRYGGELAVSTMALYGVPLLVIMYLCLGLSNGAQPIVSYNYGAGRADRVASANRVFILASFACAAILWLAAMFAPRLLWTAFTSDQRLIAYATDQTRIFFAVLVLGGIQYAHLYIIKFLGKVKISLFLGVLKRLILLLPLIFILPAVLPGDKARAVLMASPVADGVAFVVTAFCYVRVMRQITKTEQSEGVRT